MNFEFDTDLRAFGDQLRRALAQVAPLDAARAATSDGRHDAAAWRLIVDQGLAACAIPEADGGTGLGAFPLCVGAEEIGWACAAVPASGSLYQASHALALSTNDEAKARWLPDLASGRSIGSAALSRPQPLTCSAGRLTGTVMPVPGGLSAGVATVLVDKTVFAIDLDKPGVRRSALATLDPARPIARLELDDVEAMPIGDAGLAQAVVDRAAVFLAFEAIGGAARALEIARLYALEREAFGRRIASYQAIKHKLADIWSRIEIARAHALYGAWAVETDSSDLPLAAAAARVAASDAFLFAAQESLQVHGGYGFTFAADCHLFYRRARSLAAVIGAPPRWQARLAALLAAGAQPLH